MKQSPFDLSNQSPSSKIIVALERISEAFRVLLWNEGKNNSLSPIQVQVLIYLLFHSQENCRVSNLASEFNMTKATISDSVNSLLAKKLIIKTGDKEDTRSFTISLTKEGKKIAQRCSSFTSAIETPLLELSANQKEEILSGLLQLIKQLNAAGIITVQRMCLNCRFYSENNGTGYCNLLNQPLAKSDLRVDCPDYELIEI